MKEILENQRQFYNTGKTRSFAFRMKALTRLEQAVSGYETQIKQALKKDLNKSPVESYMTEIGMILEEISYLKHHLKKWMEPKKIR